MSHIYLHILVPAAPSVATVLLMARACAVPDGGPLEAQTVRALCRASTWVVTQAAELEATLAVVRAADRAVLRGAQRRLEEQAPAWRELHECLGAAIDALLICTGGMAPGWDYNPVVDRALEEGGRELAAQFGLKPSGPRNRFA